MLTKQALFKGKDYITTQEWADFQIETLLDVPAISSGSSRAVFLTATCRTKRFS